MGDPLQLQTRLPRSSLRSQSAEDAGSLRNPCHRGSAADSARPRGACWVIKTAAARPWRQRALGSEIPAPDYPVHSAAHQLQTLAPSGIAAIAGSRPTLPVQAEPAGPSGACWPIQYPHGALSCSAEPSRLTRGKVPLLAKRMRQGFSENSLESAEKPSPRANPGELEPAPPSRRGASPRRLRPQTCDARGFSAEPFSAKPFQPSIKSSLKNLRGEPTQGRWCQRSPVAERPVPNV
jgi:hypothetical protein